MFTLKLEGSFSEAEKKQACNLLQADKAVESDRTPNITGNVATVATPHTELDGESVRFTSDTISSKTTRTMEQAHDAV